LILSPVFGSRKGLASGGWSPDDRGQIVPLMHALASLADKLVSESFFQAWDGCFGAPCVLAGQGLDG
jgi:hypothetical protein